MAAPTFQQLLAEINKGTFQPVYYLFGEEGYYLDQLEHALEQRVLAGAEPSFNLDVFYGAEATAAHIQAAVRSFPVMAPRRLVLVREAHKLRKDVTDKLTAQLDTPVPTTVLAFIHRDKKGPDARTGFGKKLKDKAVYYEAKALYDNQVPKAVEDIVALRGLQIEPAALQLLTASLGTSLQRIATELDKLALQLLPAGEGPRLITRNLVHELVGIDREFNVYELINQIGARQVAKAHQTLDFLLQNLKANPPVVLIGQLYGFFAKLALLKQEKIQEEGAIASALGIPPFFAKDYRKALGLYTYPQLTQGLQHIAQADQALKGILTTRMDEGHILKTLLFNLLQRY
jgi:DNA polymerase III subunit delta